MTEITITDIAFISNDRENKEGIEFYLFNRSTGESLEDVSAAIWKKERKRDNNNKYVNKYIKIDEKLFHPNKDGYLIIPKNAVQKKGTYLQFINGDNDEDIFYAFNDGFRHNVFGGVRNKEIKKSYLFTDRSIYRPGQTVYFKSISLEVNKIDNKKNRPLENYKQKVTLYDVNNQEVSSINLTTNEFGSVSGSFKLPANSLNGNFRIKSSYGRINISVEEYKRPKFFAKFNDLSEDYKLNDLVTIIGKADSYAGFGIDNAKVSYKVTREVFFPFIWCYRYYHYPFFNNRESKIIKNGETITNEKGEFQINFTALPDLTANKTFQPAFSYSISADITDITTGETKTITKKIKIGYSSLVISNSLTYNLLINR